MKSRYKLSHSWQYRRDLPVRRDGDWNTLHCEWWLCGAITAQYFDIPDKIERIELVISSREIADTYKIHADHNGVVTVFSCTGKRVIWVDDSVSEIVRQHCNAGTDDFAYVWVEYEE